MGAPLRPQMWPAQRLHEGAALYFTLWVPESSKLGSEGCGEPRTEAGLMGAYSQHPATPLSVMLMKVKVHGCSGLFQEGSLKEETCS